MITVIIPFYNEAESLLVLINRLIKTADKMGEPYEIVMVDDGSTDNPQEQIRQLPSNIYIKFVCHQRRMGKGKALQTGIGNAAGEIIALMDADLQDDPADLPKFFRKISDGYDLVNGIRTKRQDSWLIKIYSRTAKKFLQLFLHSPFTDINCGYKMFRKKVLDKVPLYGNNFRFLPLAAYYQGFKVTEIPIVNHPRIYGRSKFGPGKLAGGVFDTFTAYFIYKFAEQPLHFFGPVGSILFIAGFLLTGYLAIERLFFGVMLYRRPALLLGILLIIVGLQVIMTGVIGELIVYLNKRDK